MSRNLGALTSWNPMGLFRPVMGQLYLYLQYFNYLDSITNDARCTSEIKPRVTMATAAFNKKRALFTSKLDFNIRKKLVKCHIWSIALCGAEIVILGKLDHKYLGSFEICC
jgi:hypothetical protein